MIFHWKIGDFYIKIRKILGDLYNEPLVTGLISLLVHQRISFQRSKGEAGNFRASIVAISAKCSTFCQCLSSFCCRSTSPPRSTAQFIRMKSRMESGLGITDMSSRFRQQPQSLIMERLGSFRMNFIKVIWTLIHLFSGDVKFELKFLFIC